MTGTLSAAGLRTLHDLMTAHVDEGRIPGIVTLVARGDDVHVDTVGTPAFDDPTPLARDAIFRIASMTKPMTAATTMALVDDGVLALGQPIDDLVPELAHRRVLRSVDAELDDTVPARRAITVEDLLTSRMGLGSVMAPPGAYPIQRAEAALGLQSIGGPPWPPVAHDVDGWIAALGTLPLLHHPGEQWLYNTSLQVLGVAVARAAGRPLSEVMHDRLFAPLGMVDTGFSVAAAQLHRVTTFYAPDPETDALSVVDTPADSFWARPPRWPDSSGWLVSTVDDVWRFAAMLRAGGTLDGTRVLSADAVTRMATDHLTAAQRAGAGVFLGDHCGWGYGMEVPAAGTPGYALPYGYGWDGGSGTAWRTNAERDVTGILLTQRQLTSPEPPPVYADFWTGVNAATVLADRRTDLST